MSEKVKQLLLDEGKKLYGRSTFVAVLKPKAIVNAVRVALGNAPLPTDVVYWQYTVKVKQEVVGWHRI